MIRNNVGEEVEPEERDLVEDSSFVRDAGGQDVIEGGNAVAGDEKQMLVVDVVHVANLAAGVKFEVREVGVKKDGIEEVCAHD